MEELRNELWGAQKAQVDFIKWKLLLIAPIGATGLGLTGANNFPYAELVLCLVPLVCAYVDLAYYQQSLIISVISKFYSLHENSISYSEYEKFSESVKTLGKIELREFLPKIGKIVIGAFDFNYVVISVSSLLLSILLIAYSLLIKFGNCNSKTWSLLFTFGIFGAFYTYILKKAYRIRKDRISNMEKNKKGKYVRRTEKSNQANSRAQRSPSRWESR